MDLHVLSTAQRNHVEIPIQQNILVTMTILRRALQRYSSHFRVKASYLPLYPVAGGKMSCV